MPVPAHALPWSTMGAWQLISTAASPVLKFGLLASIGALLARKVGSTAARAAAYLPRRDPIAPHLQAACHPHTGNSGCAWQRDSSTSQLLCFHARPRLQQAGAGSVAQLHRSPLAAACKLVSAAEWAPTNCHACRVVDCCCALHAGMCMRACAPPAAPAPPLLPLAPT